MSKHRVVINHFHIFSLRNKIAILIDPTQNCKSVVLIYYLLIAPDCVPEDTYKFQLDMYVCMSIGISWRSNAIIMQHPIAYKSSKIFYDSVFTRCHHYAVHIGVQLNHGIGH